MFSSTKLIFSKGVREPLVCPESLISCPGYLNPVPRDPLTCGCPTSQRNMDCIRDLPSPSDPANPGFAVFNQSYPKAWSDTHDRVYTTGGGSNATNMELRRVEVPDGNDYAQLTIGGIPPGFYSTPIPPGTMFYCGSNFNLMGFESFVYRVDEWNVVGISQPDGKYTVRIRASCADIPNKNIISTPQLSVLRYVRSDPPPAGPGRLGKAHVRLSCTVNDSMYETNPTLRARIEYRANPGCLWNPSDAWATPSNPPPPPVTHTWDAVLDVYNIFRENDPCVVDAYDYAPVAAAGGSVRAYVMLPDSLNTFTLHSNEL